MLLTWAHRALDDLSEIEIYIARRNPGAAQTWVERLIALAESLPSAPMRGRMVPQFAPSDIREVFLGSYRLIYRVTQTEVQVLGVVEGHRRLPPDLDRPTQ